MNGILNNKKINAHGHLLPEPSQIPSFIKRKKLFWIDGDKKYMYQGNWKRPITDQSFFIDGKLEWLKKNGIQKEVLITLSQLYGNGLDRKTSLDLIKFQNDFHGQIQDEYPETFIPGFVVQPAHIDQSLKEIERCVEDLGLTVLCLPTHYTDHNKIWKSVANEDVYPIFDLANIHKLAIQVHPYDAPKMINLEDRYWRFHLIWMCAQTADTYHMYSLLGLYEKFPNCRTCFAHGNQFGQVNIGRRHRGYVGRPDLFEEAKDPLAALKKSNIFFDTLVHDPSSLRLLIEKQGIDQIVAGIDDPYPLGEMESVDGSYPGKVLDEAVSLGFINKQEKENIWHKNVLNWLYG